MSNQHIHAMIAKAASLTERANHCQRLLTAGLGIPVTLISGGEANKAKAKALIVRARKIRLARELTREAFTHGTRTERFEELNCKLVALR